MPYFRINGCYEALDSGNLSDALLDFTGGISESVDIRGGKYATDEEKRSALFKLLLKQKQNFALMCCSIEVIITALIQTNKNTDNLHFFYRQNQGLKLRPGTLLD